MGMLLSFVPRTPAPASRPQLAGVEASIIIFPGVRYEHAAAEPADVRKADRAREAGDKVPSPRH